jgi:diguanylate cyclase (GGDEF)-like protein
MKILLLEDDIALNKAIKKVLELDNYQVESFIDGEEIVNTLDQEFDLYILDINVPHISGLELLEMIMSNNRYAKVIMISSNTDLHSLKSAYESGCVDYLKKPFYIEELRVKISRLNVPEEEMPSEIKLKEEYALLGKEEKKLLFLLLDQQEYVVTYEMIKDFVYENHAMTKDTLNTLVEKLQTKLSDRVTVRHIADEGYSISMEDSQNINRMDTSQRVLALQKENTLLKLEKELLLKRSITDPLTGLYNRLKIKELFLKERQCLRHKREFLSLILMDLDNFKEVNDRYGHNTGDRYLKVLAAQLKTDLRPDDIIGRWGGEEFIILLPGASLADAKRVAEHLKQKISEIECPIIGLRTASFGVAEVSANDTLENIVQRADEALLSAKEHGKNRVEVSLA